MATTVDVSDEPAGADVTDVTVVAVLGATGIGAVVELLEPVTAADVVEGNAVSLLVLASLEELLLPVGATTALVSSDEIVVLLVPSSATGALLESPLVSAPVSPAPPSPGPVNFHQLNLNPPPVKRRNMSCLPVAPFTSHVWLAHVCAPPVAATVHVAIVSPSSESRCSSIAPVFAEATRISSAVAPSPNSTSFNLM